MTGPENYHEASELLLGVDACEYGCPHTGCAHEMRTLLRAQVHATLALAAAVGNNESSRGQTNHESNAWYLIAGTKPEEAGK